MEAYLESLKEAVPQALVSIFFGGLLFFLVIWLRRSFTYLHGHFEERKMSRRTLQTRKRKEAQVISDGTTILLKELKEQGLLTPEGQKFWENKLKTIGLVKPEEDNLLGKAWHYPVTHSMRELKKYLTRPKASPFTPKKKKEDKSTRVYCD